MSRFNIRVYGVLTHPQHGVLVTDELIRGLRVTKFPGGGLEFGEGTRECLKREFMEELNLDVVVEEHLYTTDFFVISAFNNRDQIISIYYRVRSEQYPEPGKKLPFTFNEAEMEKYALEQETETARFILWEEWNENSVTLPIDKIVAAMIRPVNPTD